MMKEYLKPSTDILSTSFTIMTQINVIVIYYSHVKNKININFHFSFKNLFISSFFIPRLRA